MEPFALAYQIKRSEPDGSTTVAWWVGELPKGWQLVGVDEEFTGPVNWLGGLPGCPPDVYAMGQA